MHAWEPKSVWNGEGAGQATQVGAPLFSPRLACLLAPLPGPPPLTPHVCLAQITDILVVNHRKLWKSNILAAKLYCDPCTLLD